MDSTIDSILKMVLKVILQPLIPILIGLALIIFAWGLFKYIKTGLGDKNEVEGAKSLMLWGVIIFFVMVSVWGLVAILQNIFFGGIDVPTYLPQIPTFGI